MPAADLKNVSDPGIVMDLHDAAAVLLVGSNATHFLNAAKLQAGGRVLINVAGGSIGARAMQIANAHRLVEPEEAISVEI